MKKLITIVLILAVALSSCTHYYYLPNTQNVPLFKEKNEYRLFVGSIKENEILSTEVQGAYSVTNHFAVMANFMSAMGGDQSKNNWGKGNYLDCAIGYYKPFDKFAVFEIYGGFGASNQHHQYQLSSSSFSGGATTYYNSGTADLSFTKFFIQPSIGLTFKAFDIALSSRLCNLSFYKIDNQIDMQNPEFYFLDTLAQNRNPYLLETALTIRGGWKYAKIQLQIGGIQKFTNQNLHFRTSHVSIGIYFTIAQRYWRKSTITVKD